MVNGIHPRPQVHPSMGPPPPTGGAQSGPSPQQQGPSGHQIGQPPLGFPAQPNGAASSSRPPQLGPQQPGHQPGAPQRLGPGGPFTGPSPTMVHSAVPPQPGQPGAPQGPQPYPPVGAYPGGMPQHMRSMPNGGGALPSPGYPGAPAGSSRAPTPAGAPNGSLTHPSPGMAHRVPPTLPAFGAGGTPVANVAQPPMVIAGRGGVPFENTLAELQKIEQNVMNELRAELSLGNKNLASMTPDEKHRLLETYKAKYAGNAPGPRGGAGPSQQRPQKRGSASVSPGNEVSQKIPCVVSEGLKITYWI